MTKKHHKQIGRSTNTFDQRVTQYGR